MAKSTKTLSEKMQEALQKKAKAERQIALLKTRDRKADDKAKILLGVMITKTLKENHKYFETVKDMAELFLTESDQKIVFDYLSKYITPEQTEEVQKAVHQIGDNNQNQQSPQPALD